MKLCHYCQQPLIFVSIDVETCTNCSNQVDYIRIQAAYSWSEDSKQISWMCTHNDQLYQVMVFPSANRTVTHCCIIRRIDQQGQKRPVLLKINQLTDLTPSSTTEEFNKWLEPTSYHPTRKHEIICHFCQAPMASSIGSQSLDEYPRFSASCNSCKPGMTVYHGFEKTNNGFEMTAIWFYVTINTRNYFVSFDVKKNTFSLKHEEEDGLGTKTILELDKIPHITPQNAEDKIQTMLVFS